MTAFRTGADKVEIGGERSFLIAVPEKALADKLRLDRASIRTQKELQTYLYDDLRIEPAAIQEMSPDRLEEYADRYRSRKILLLSKLARRLFRSGGGNANA
jgi:hypothetical protein